MNSRAGSGAVGATADYKLVLTLSVGDVAALWDAALRKCTEATEELTLDEVVEAIGPRADPSIEDCLTMLGIGTQIEGCIITDIAIGRDQPAPAADQDPSPPAAELPDPRSIEVPQIFNYLPPLRRNGTNVAIHEQPGAIHGPS